MEKFAAKGECDGVADLAVSGAEEHRVAALMESLAQQELAGPLVVGAIGDHELHFIARTQVGEIRPAIAVLFAAAGGLHVEDADHARVARRDVDRAARLDDGGAFW